MKSEKTYEKKRILEMVLEKYYSEEIEIAKNRVKFIPKRSLLSRGYYFENTGGTND